MAILYTITLHHNTYILLSYVAFCLSATSSQKGNPVIFCGHEYIINRHRLTAVQSMLPFPISQAGMRRVSTYVPPQPSFRFPSTILHIDGVNHTFSEPPMELSIH